MVEINPKQVIRYPVQPQLPKPEERVFENQLTSKKEYTSLKPVDIKFGKLTEKNVEQFRVLTYLNLPVVYSEDFYLRLTSYQRYSKLAYLKDVLVGAISCKIDTEENEQVVYIMTITVLKPYRRLGIGSKLLEEAINDCAREKQIKKLKLHVQSVNESALAFYEKHGFKVAEVLENYYTDIEPADCKVLLKELE